MRTFLPSLTGVLFVVAAAAHAQDSSATTPLRTLADRRENLPAGTQLLAQLQAPLRTRLAKPGDSVYLQTTFPLSGSGGILIPAGTHMLATLDQVEPHWSTPSWVELKLHVSSLLFANGYVVTATVPAHAASSSDASLRPDPHGTNAAGFLVAVAGTLAGLGIVGSAHSPPAAVAAFAGTALFASGMALATAGSRGMILEAGLPLALVLAGPITLDERRAAAAAPVQNVVQSWPARFPPSPPGPQWEPTHLCFQPGTPGTPDIVIPGSPGDGPGLLPTPPTVIPGTPPTPDVWSPCR